MGSRKIWDFLKESDVTPEPVFENRRKWIQALGAGSVAGVGANLWSPGALASSTRLSELPDLAAKPSRWSSVEKPTSSELVTTYNNFYEFGTQKSDPSRNADTLKTRPWTVVVEGEVNKPQVFDLDALMKLAPMEERIYRLRCVEAWSVVVPWIGFPLSVLLKAVEPNSKAKFVAFETLADPKQMPGLRSPVLEWPYREGLRLDEAYHDLTLLTFGQYGKVLPNQSGAPVRVVVPWKYGFKSAKSIVRIRLTDKQPVTSWNQSNPTEYGFFSNVNPNVNHPRWSQGSERRLGEGALGGLFTPRRQTEMFNGYASSVAGLYKNLDLTKWI